MIDPSKPKAPNNWIEFPEKIKSRQDKKEKSKRLAQTIGLGAGHVSGQPGGQAVASDERAKRRQARDINRGGETLWKVNRTSGKRKREEHDVDYEPQASPGWGRARQKLKRIRKPWLTPLDDAGRSVSIPRGQQVVRPGIAEDWIDSLMGVGVPLSTRTPPNRRGHAPSARPEAASPQKVGGVGDPDDKDLEGSA